MSILQDIVTLHRPKDPNPVSEGRVKDVRFRYERSQNKEEMFDNVNICNIRTVGKQ